MDFCQVPPFDEKSGRLTIKLPLFSFTSSKTLRFESYLVSFHDIKKWRECFIRKFNAELSDIFYVDDLSQLESMVKKFTDDFEAE